MRNRTVYYVKTGITEEQHAGQKARRDIEQLAEQFGLRPIVFGGALSSDGSIRSMASLIFRAAANWLGLLKVRQNSVILFQYPHRPVKTAVLACFLMPLIRLVKKCEFTALVHDLDSIRKTNGKAAVFSDQYFLPAFDHIICHNEKMKEYLMAQGVPARKLVVLGVFDYLCDAKREPKEDSTLSVCIAGNLTPEQSGYVYRLIDDPGRDYVLHLYGTGFAYEGALPDNVIYHGSVDADHLPGVLEGTFGLVWGGESTASCTGNFGNYLKYNDPHKLSLYLAAGMPVIIWSEAACAGLVTGKHAGIAVENLEELGGKLKEGYRDIDRQSIRRLQDCVTKGAFFRHALSRSVKRD